MTRSYAAARGAGLLPAGHMRFILECLFLALPQRRPGPDCHVGDLEKVTRDIVTLCQLCVENPVQARGFLGVSVLSVG